MSFRKKQEAERFTFRLTPEVTEKMDILADGYGIPPTAVVEIAIRVLYREYLKEKVQERSLEDRLKEPDA